VVDVDNNMHINGFEVEGLQCLGLWHSALGISRVRLRRHTWMTAKSRGLLVDFDWPKVAGRNNVMNDD